MSKIRNFCIIAHIDHGKSTLADRMLETTNTIEKRMMREQVLDQMDLERERGITIKLQPVRMEYQGYILNLIDTPGHVDFTYEVSRSLAAVEGAILLIDATQGIEAQTISNLYQALTLDLVIIPVINKIDLPAANPQLVAREIKQLLGCELDEIIYTSGKTGQGVEDLLHEIITKIPAPEGRVESQTRALVFDSKYDSFRGVIAYVRMIDGVLNNRNKIKLLQTGGEEEALEIGYFIPGMIKSEELCSGEIGYIITNFKNVSQVLVGDTLTLSQNKDIQPLPGFKVIQPNVYASVYSIETEKYQKLREGLEKLKLNDAALSFEPEKSQALGFGFHCGFLGLLHLEIIKERLEREYGLNLLTTTPSVSYKLKLTDCSEAIIHSPQDLPDPSLIKKIMEPVTLCEVITPNEYLGKVYELINNSRGVLNGTSSFDEKRTLLTVKIPLSEVIVNFFDRLKSISQGYASMSYLTTGYQPANLVKLDFLIASEEVKPLSIIVPNNQLEGRARFIVKKLKNLIPRANFTIAIQASVYGRIIARETISALKKDVTEKLYGGDATRKMKLIEKQRKGKKRMAKFGKVEIPTNVFLNLFKD